MSGSCSQYSRKSLPERSALSPIVTNDENPMPRAAAASIAALPNPPLCEAKATSPGDGAAGATVAFSAISGRGLATPREFGPTIRMPAARQTASSSSWRARPAGPISAKPAVRTTSARTPLAAHARATSTTAFAGTTITASSTSPSTSPIERTVGRPATSPPCTLTRCSDPENPAAIRLRTTSPPTVPSRRDAPITATEDGRRTCADGRDVGLALALLEAPPRVPRQRRRELDLDRILRPAGGDEEPGFVEHPEHPVVARQDGRGERLDTRRRRGMGEMREQNGGDPVAVPGIGHREGDLRPPGRPADVGAVPDDRALGSPQRDQRQPVAGGRGAARGRIEIDAGAEEPKPARLFRQRGEKRAQPRHVLNRRRPHMHGRAVTQHDVGLSGDPGRRSRARHGSHT